MSARAVPSSPATDHALVAEDPRMREIVTLVERLAKAGSNVLVSGESGTGKDVVAQALHFWGDRAAGPLVKVDLASLPATLIESELFGYERGAFTGANAAKPGRLELSGHGTLFLDHVGELTSVLQAKLLRVVEDRRFERLGGTESLELDARIVATASADLEEAVARGSFRRDLFHRLGVFWIRLPPLRERPSDIEPLAQSFLSRELEKHPRGASSLAEDVIEAFAAYAWPGNVRELKAAVEHGVLMSSGSVVELADVPAQLLDFSRTSSRAQKSPTLAEVEKSYIAKVLREVGGNQTRAAQVLGISRKSLWERRRRYGLDK